MFATNSGPSGHQEDSNNTSAANIRWWPLLAAWTLGVVLQLVAAFFLSENLTYLAFASVFVIWPLTVFLSLLWWIFWSCISWTTCGEGLAVVVGVCVTFVAVFRFDEFDGAMLPRFSRRWSPTAEARAEQFFKNRPASSATIVATTEQVSSDVRGDPMNPTAEDWPEYQGRNRDGVVTNFGLRTDWDARPPKKLWRQPIGLSWGSFAVVGQRAWTLEQRGPDEFVVCYDIESGHEFWSHSDAVRFESVQGGNGPRSTPTVHDGKVFSLGGTGILNCLDAKSGQRIWSRNILEEAGSSNLPWGQAGSPLIVDDFVIVSPGSNDTVSKAKNAAVIAYRRDTGEKVWASENRQGSYSSPHLATLNGERQVLVFDGIGLLALSPENGSNLWNFPWSNSPQVNAAQPIVLDDKRVLIGSGYGVGSVLLEVQPVSQSDASRHAKEIWTSKQFKLKFNCGVRRGDYLFGLDEGLLTCLSLQDGQRRWKQGRYGYGQLLLVEDKLLILSEDGDVVLVPATPEPPRELARFSAIEGKCWSNPVIARGRLLVRNSTEAACYDLRGTEENIR